MSKQKTKDDADAKPFKSVSVQIRRDTKEHGDEGARIDALCGDGLARHKRGAIVREAMLIGLAALEKKAAKRKGKVSA